MLALVRAGHKTRSLGPDLESGPSSELLDQTSREIDFAPGARVRLRLPDSERAGGEVDIPPTERDVFAHSETSTGQSRDDRSEPLVGGFEERGQLLRLDGVGASSAGAFTRRRFPVAGLRSISSYSTPPQGSGPAGSGSY